MAIWPGTTPGLANTTLPINRFTRRKGSSMTSMESVPAKTAAELRPGIDVAPATASAIPPAPTGTKLKDWTAAAGRGKVNLQPTPNQEGLKIYGLLKGDPILSKMLDKCQASKGLSEEMQGVWLRARAERLRKLLVDNVPNGASKIHSVTIQRDLAMSQTGVSYGFEIGYKTDEGHVITGVSTDGPAHNVIFRADHILIVNQQLAIDCNHEEMCKIFADSRKLNMTVLRFGEESSTETPTRRSRPQHRHADVVTANANSDATGPSPVMRSKPVTVELTVTRGPAEPLGLTLATIQAVGQATTTVSSVVAGGAADLAGIRSGDVVRSVNGRSTAGLSHKTILDQIRTVVGAMVFAVERDPALRPLTVVEADPSLFAMQRTETSLSPVVRRRPKDGTDVKKNMQRRDTVYLSDVAVPKSLPLLARMRGGGGPKQAMPSSFAVPTLSKDDAKLILASSGDGAYLFREARGVIVLSVVHEGEVMHYTLKISLSLQFREVDKALRKFVKHYTNKRATGLPCTLTEYIMDMPSAAVDDGGNIASLGAADDDEALAMEAVGTVLASVPTNTQWEGASQLSTRKVTARRDGSTLAFGQAPIGESALDEDLDNDCLDEDGLPVRRSPSNPSPVQGEGGRGAPQSSLQAVPQSQTEGPATFAMPPPPTAAPAADAAAPAASAAAPAAEATADGGSAAGEKKPRRRKLVRGANAIQAKVLPEFQQALDALDDLDSFLNVYEEMHLDYESLEGEKAGKSGIGNKSFFSFKNLVKPTHKGFADLPSLPTPAGDGDTDSFDRSSRRGSAYAPGANIAKQPAKYAMAMDTLF